MKKRVFSVLTMLLVLLCVTVPVSAAVKLKTYKASKVTAKQIVAQLKKVNKVGTTRNHKADKMTTGQANSYKSKFSFFDKKYNKTYCSVEVFVDAYDAATRNGYIMALWDIQSYLGIEESVPWGSFRYKNVVFRYPSEMPYKYAVTYYKNIKKIVK